MDRIENMDEEKLVESVKKMDRNDDDEGDEKKLKRKYCCGFFLIGFGILLWLWLLKSLSTEMCPW